LNLPDSGLHLKPGGLVFAATSAVNFDGHSEYKCLPKIGVLGLKPDNLTYQEAGAVPGGGMTALQCLKKRYVVIIVR
jgi:NADPH:quinone reductase-like Zn-dependent oxidoreductase